MKKLFAIIMFACSLFVSTAGVAGTVAVPVDGLSKQQVQQLKDQAAKMKSESGSPGNLSAIVRGEAAAWGELGENMGKAVVGAAKEIGVAAADFSNTPLGKIVVAIVVIKIVGVEVMGFIAGSMILLIGAGVFIYLITTRFGNKKYEYKPYLWGLWNKKVVVSVEEDSDYLVGRLVACAAVVLVSLASGLSVMF